MRQCLLMSWILIMTGVMAGLVILTLPDKPVVASPITVSRAKFPCDRGIIRDVNNCGGQVIHHCKLLQTGPGGPGIHPNHGRQCEICRIWQIQIQGYQHSEKRWYDCNNDNVADCEIWWAWWQLKGCNIGGTTSLPDPFAIEATECLCPIDEEV